MMAERSNTGQRQRYIQFRFEQSLRRYQPPPRKLIKPNQSVCKNCYRKSCESGRQNRIMRLCQTRRIYNATSRERASEFSRKKQAVQESVEKASGHVSDFNCHQNIQSNKSVKPLQHNHHNSQINLESSDLQINQNKDKRIKWSINISETPIKQSVRINLQNLCLQQQGSMIDESKEQNNNVYKVKDIDFHIGLVEQLHQKILKQYTKLQNQIMQQQPIQQSILLPQQIIKQCKNIDEQNKQNNNQNKIQTQNERQQTVQSASKEQKQKQNRENINQNKVNQIIQFCVEYQNKNSCLPIINIINNNKQQINQQISQIFYTQNQTIIKNQVQKTSGRIILQGDKGSCYVSARILNKLLSSKNSPNRITSTFIRHHSYLGDPKNVLQIFTEKQNIT